MKFIKGFLVLCIVVLILQAGVKGAFMMLEKRGHVSVQTQAETFTESDLQLDNPNRGFYHMYGVMVSDTMWDGDLKQQIEGWKKDTSLIMVELNFREYRDRQISEKGLENLRKLLGILSREKQQYIIRCLYDWNGENGLYEPDSMEIILKHMDQVGAVLSDYSDSVFTLQGLFIGNWGEMNGSKYNGAQEIRQLAEKLASATSPELFLAVRMPMHWRIATGTGQVQEKTETGALTARLGLFNDGMLGDVNDSGTYGNHTRAEHGDHVNWNRLEELEFQDVLCKRVPNGGEVIHDNIYNDPGQAVADLRKMHVTYLNRDYDMAVLNKWAEAVTETTDRYSEMDYLSYIERMLGYRLVLRGSELKYTFLTDKLKVSLSLENVGFAPLYKEAVGQILLREDEAGQVWVYETEGDLRQKTQKADEGEKIHLEAGVPLKGRTSGRYTLYLKLTDKASGEMLKLAIDQEPEEYGYRIGSITLRSLEDHKNR